MEIFIVRFCETLGKFLSNYIVKKVEFPFLWTSWLIQYLYKGIFNEFLPSFLEIRGFDTEHKLFALLYKVLQGDSCHRQKFQFLTINELIITPTTQLEKLPWKNNYLLWNIVLHLISFVAIGGKRKTTTGSTDEHLTQLKKGTVKMLNYTKDFREV